MTFNFSVKGDEITLTGTSRASSGGANCYRCEFEFSPEWENLEKFAVFACGGVSYTVMLQDGFCLVPQEVTEKAGGAKIGVYGSLLGEERVFRISTDFSHIVVKEGAYCQGTAPAVPEPDEWEEYISRIADRAAENAVGGIEEALDSIIEIQNGIAGVR